MSRTFKADGESHTVKKNKKGDVIVDHAGNKGPYDKINLTKKAGAKTVKQGVAATKKWHSNHSSNRGK
jgi:hypothetical protein